MSNKKSKRKVRERLGVTGDTIRKIKFATGDGARYKHAKPKEYITVISGIQSNSVYDFCHSDESRTIGSNSRKIAEVDRKKHVGRVWLVPTVRE